MWCDVFTRVTCQMHVRGMSTKEPNVFWQKSPIYSDKRALYILTKEPYIRQQRACDVTCSRVWHAKCMFVGCPRKSPMYFDKRALYILTKEPYIFWQKSPIYSDKRALYKAATCVWCDVFTRVTCQMHIRGMSTKETKGPYMFWLKSPIFWQKSPINSEERDLYILTKEPRKFWQKSPIYSDKRALHILTKKPYVFWQESPKCLDQRARHILTKEPCILCDTPRAYLWNVT